MARREGGLVATLFGVNDLLNTLVACLLVIVAILIVQVKKSAEAETQSVPPGSVSVYAFWRDGVNVDVDLHMASPDGEHVFFSHMADRIWNLLRDDLGTTGDNTPRNFENAYARGLIPGEYVINLHLYRGNATDLPITVDAEVRITTFDYANAQPNVIINKAVILTHQGDEQTVLRFTIGADGYLVPGSMSDLPVSIIRLAK